MSEIEGWGGGEWGTLRGLMSLDGYDVLRNPDCPFPENGKRGNVLITENKQAPPVFSLFQN